MKTITITALLLASILSSGFFVSADQIAVPAATITVNTLTKATVYQGEVMPHITLPVVEITAVRRSDHMVKAIVVDGKVMPHVVLDEFVVTPNS